MKQLTKAVTYKTILTLFVLGFLQAIAWAQDSAASTTQTTTTSTSQQTNWYAQPWVWVVGGIILLLLIISLVRGSGSANSKTDRVTYTKTTERDTNP
jgi:hypothetical protein